MVASVADTFVALANPVRRELLSLLREEPMSAGDLADRFELSRPAVAEHLQLLRECGLVVSVKSGRHSHYHLVAEPLAEIGEWLHPFEKYWRAHLRTLATIAEEEL